MFVGTIMDREANASINLNEYSCDTLPQDLKRIQETGKT
jgi:hypothetical protein